jgi:flagellar hook-associated protein 2
VLLQQAGMTGDSTEFDNAIYDEIDDYNDRIKALSNKLIDKEEAYYKKYAALEKYISQMNQQSNWITSQFSQNS